METTIELHGKSCVIRMSKAAQKQLARLDTPMLVEMEVTLACMVKKQVHFRENQTNKDAVSVADHLHICVSSGEHCAATSSGQTSEHRALPPITNWGVLVPKWLNIDYRSGKWAGDFGYTSPQ